MITKPGRLLTSKHISMAAHCFGFSFAKKQLIKHIFLTFRLKKARRFLKASFFSLSTFIHRAVLKRGQMKICILGLLCVILFSVFHPSSYKSVRVKNSSKCRFCFKFSLFIKVVYSSKYLKAQ